MKRQAIGHAANAQVLFYADHLSSAVEDKLCRTDQVPVTMNPGGVFHPPFCHERGTLPVARAG